MVCHTSLYYSRSSLAIVARAFCTARGTSRRRIWSTFDLGLPKNHPSHSRRHIARDTGFPSIPFV